MPKKSKPSLFPRDNEDTPGFTPDSEPGTESMPTVTEWAGSYQVESGIPVPTIQRRGRASKFPLDSMPPGDSFLIAGATKTSAASSALSGGKRRGFKLVARVVADGVRVWRVA